MKIKIILKKVRNRNPDGVGMVSLKQNSDWSEKK